MNVFIRFVVPVAVLVVPLVSSAQEGGFAIQPVPPLGSTPPRFTAAPGTDVGRFQIVVLADRENNVLVMLLDTKEGATWLYRPPQGNAINGYWSDIPRISYAPEFWRNVFNQQPLPTSAPPSTPSESPKPTDKPSEPASTKP
ncbi:MAG: hypothetical protein N3A53_02275 [Verrucomicrobiae bacterium]|nr:hypothetical protein [Verrucomicrobiae bacterium]